VQSADSAAGEDDLLAEQGHHANCVLGQLSVGPFTVWLKKTIATNGMLIDPEPVPIGVPLIGPTRDEPVIPLAAARQVVSMLLM
jgi:hypothetical protein